MSPSTPAAGRYRRRRIALGASITVAIILLGRACTAGGDAGTARAVPPPTTADAPATASSADRSASTAPLPGMPPVLDAHNLYSAAGAGMLSPAAAGAKAFVYVPSNDDGSVTVIDQATKEVVDHYKVGKLVQHVVPSWNLTTLYATASGTNALVPIDPITGKPGEPISVTAPYNLYFTPDGTKAVVMAERRNRINYYDPNTWHRIKSVAPPCRGVNHADWSSDGRWFLVTCEFSGQLLKVDTKTGNVLGVIDLPGAAMPQDVRIAPDGTKFYVADMMLGGLWIIDATGTKVVGQIKTGIGAHGIYPSRDGTRFYVSNRGRLMGDENRPSRPGEGSISVVDPSTDSVVATWPIPNGGSPDMGGVSADGKVLWLSGRYDAVVYAFDTATGSLETRIPVPPGPHGLCVFPQPGRYSLGHTGNTR